MPVMESTYNFDGGIRIDGYGPIDERLLLTKAQMATITGDEYIPGEPDDDGLISPSDFVMPFPTYFAFCLDDNCWYRFDYEKELGGETGKFTKVGDAASTPIAESGSTLEMQSALADAVPGDLFYNSDDGKLYACKDTPAPKHWEETSPNKGDTFYDDGEGKLKYYDGSEWKPIGSDEESSGAKPIESGSTWEKQQALADAEPGDLFLDTTDGKVYECKDTPEPKHWEETAVPEGELLYDTGDGSLLMGDGETAKPIDGTIKKVDGPWAYPTGPKKGDVIYDLNGNALKYYDGTQWLPVGGPKVVESVLAVPQPDPGLIVLDKSDGKLKYYYNNAWHEVDKPILVDHKSIIYNDNNELALQLADNSLTIQTDGVKVTREFFFGYNDPPSTLGKVGDVYFKAVED